MNISLESAPPVGFLTLRCFPGMIQMKACWQYIADTSNPKYLLIIMVVANMK